ncbi:MAG: vanomycin resistance protein VanB [Actinophytocola sp.]|nr:vanomycin resistance protein VanB [Actinophytocola sp.]
MREGLAMSDGDPAARPAEETDQARDDEWPSAETHTGDDVNATQPEPEHADADAAQGESAGAAEGEPVVDDAAEAAESSESAADEPDVAEQEPDDATAEGRRTDAESSESPPDGAAGDAVEPSEDVAAEGASADAVAEPDAGAPAVEAGTESADTDEPKTASDTDEPKTASDTDEPKTAPVAKADAEADAQAVPEGDEATDSQATGANEPEAQTAESAEAAEADETGAASEPSAAEGTAVMAAAAPVSADTGEVDADKAEADEGHTDSADETQDETPDETADETAESGTPARKPILAAVGAAVVSLFVRVRKALGIAAAVLAGLTGLYLIDLLVTQGEIPRDVVVAGVEIGGLEPIEAESVLRLRLSPRLDQPRSATADGKSIEIDPDAANVTIDWAATVDSANTPSYNPFTRALSLFTDREVTAVASGDTTAIGTTLSELAKDVDVAKVEGTVKFDGTTPVAVEPSEGKRLNVPRGVRDVITGWVERDVIPVPVDTLEVKATDNGVQRAVDGFATTAVSEPITLEARGRTLRMTPGEIADVVTFTANDDGSLSPRIPPKRLRTTMGKRLASTEVKGKDARIVFGAKKTKVKPSVDGTEVEWGSTADALLEAAATTEGRDVKVAYHHTPAELTTKELKNLGIKEVIGEFTTYDFASDSGVNIKRVAEEINGAIVRPGEVFSLNGYTGRRGIEQGYVGAAVIENGELTRAVGGGISQFATTLYNASYFAGMADVEHREHSRYISRYPLAREATVFQNPDGSSVIDLKFRNTTSNGVAIQTSWTPTSITVKLWGTKKFKVESVTSEPFNYTAAPVVVKPYGTECVPQDGAQGYSATNTRIIRTLDGELVDRQARTVVYQPTEEIQCAPPPEPDPEPEPDGGPTEPPANGSPSTEPSKPSTSKPPASNPPDDSGGLITDG